LIIKVSIVDQQTRSIEVFLEHTTVIFFIIHFIFMYIISSPKNVL